MRWAGGLPRSGFVQQTAPRRRPNLRGFCGFAALHFITKTTPAWSLVSRALSKHMNKYAYFIMTLFPLSATAEVSDKMFTQQELWLSGLLTGLGAAVFIRWSTWLNLLGVPLAALFLYFAYDTLAQSDIGSAIIQEQGTPYIFALYGSAILVVVGVLIGNFLNKVKVSRSA